MLHLLACLLLVTALFALLRSRPASPGADVAPLLGCYMLGEKLGEGGGGVVYRAEHVTLKHAVAIKLPSPRRTSDADLQRFEREAELARSLQHAGTVAVYDVGHTRDGLPYYAMELVDGIDLQTLVERRGPLEPPGVVQMLMQLAATLSELHAAGVLHGDIKPANVMAYGQPGAADRLELLDFGSSLRLGEHPTGRAPLLGTPLYLPPEAICAPECVGAHSDVYSLGALGYFLLTGQPPFAGSSVLEVCAHHLHSTPLLPSRRLGLPLPEGLERLIVSCLAKRPRQRPSSADLLAALTHLVQPASSARPVSRVPHQLAAAPPPRSTPALACPRPRAGMGQRPAPAAATLAA